MVKTPSAVCLADLTNRYAGPICKHARGNVHRLQLLEKQLGRIGDVDLRNPGLVSAGPAFERLLRQLPINSC